MPRRLATHLVSFAAVLCSVAIAACANDNIVYRDRNVVGVTPPAAAANFVGYSDTARKTTSCGNCHVDQQAAWVSTKHANAWADLQASGHASSSCFACHAVSQLGNSVKDTLVGYVATKDPRYYDVQCENCHGPGLDHVTAPSLANRPLPSIAVDTSAKQTNGCGECHTGTHEPYVDEWKQTAVAGHAHVEPHAIGNADPTCVTCHTGQGALAMFNVNTAYKEAGAANTAPVPVTCAVCHDPHANDKPGQLRFAVDSPDPNQNLCMKCHNRDAAANPTARYGPMTPETATLFGTAGWWPPGTSLSNPSAFLDTHGSSANPRLCAGCHVTRTTVTDPKTGSFVFQATGHNFAAAPCLDSKGIPTNGTCDVTQRSFTACAASGCHGTPAVAQSLFTSDSVRITALEATLKAQLAKVPSTELNYSSTTLTTAKGATWNLGLAQKPGAFIHNPFLVEALLTASIKQVTKDYGIAATSTVTLDNVLPARHR